MNEIVNKFLLTVDVFIRKLDLGQSGFTCSASKPFTKHREKIKNFKETSDSNYIC